jgi:acyl-CoA thioesterase-1
VTLRPGGSRLPVTLAALVLAAACARGRPGTIEAEVLPPPFTYVAVGASETVGIGADDPLTQSWPSVFHRTALARSATLVNVGVSGATVSDALELELEPALAEEPRLVTVWLNVNDLLTQVPVEQYEGDLRTLVRALRRGGATDMLVANTPPVVDLPVVRACLPPSGACPLPFEPGPAEAITARVAAYNAAIARVAEAEGALVVDLDAAAGGRIDDALVAADGFHPSTEGHRRVAAAFADALASLPSAAELRPPGGRGASG